MMVRVAVIGYGYLGRWHVEKAMQLAECEFVAAIDHGSKAQAQFRSKYPEGMIVTSLEEIENEIDAAIIATPTSCHFDFMRKLLVKKKHIFCEKPLVSNLAEALEIQRLCQNNEVVLQVGHSERFHKIWEERNKFPEFFDFSGIVHMRRMAPFKKRVTDVDVIQDLMIHDIDLMLYLFSEWPVSVWAKGYKIKTSKWDFVSAHFEFSSARSITVTASRCHHREIRELEIINESGCFYVDTMNYKSKVVRSNSEQGMEELNYIRRDHLLEEQKMFYQAINRGGSAVVGINDGVNAIKLAEAVLESLNNGQKCLIV